MILKHHSYISGHFLTTKKAHFQLRASSFKPLKKLYPKHPRIIHKSAHIAAHIVHTQKAELAPTYVVNPHRVLLVRLGIGRGECVRTHNQIKVELVDKRQFPKNKAIKIVLGVQLGIGIIGAQRIVRQIIEDI